MRRVVIIVCSILAVVLAIREQSVRAPAGHLLQPLARLWPNHPGNLLRAVAFDAVSAAQSGGRMSPAGRDRASLLHRKSPLASAPLMVAGAEAQLAGDRTRAERLYAAARIRNPRDPAARMLLADSMLRRGAIREGLEEMITLSQIMPHSAGPVGPAVAAFATSPNAEESLRPLLNDHPALRAQVLTILARDAANAPLVLRLAPSPQREPGIGRPWDGTMLNALVAAGKIGEARLLWHRITGLGQKDSLILNGEFAKWEAPPPFNWEILSAPGGIAEITGKSGLSVIHYGRDDIVLARQLLSLSPARYRVVTKTDGSDPVDNLAWVVRCSSGPGLATLRFARNGGGDGTFDVPQNCPAQWIELKASIPETEATIETKILSVQIQRVAS